MSQHEEESEDDVMEVPPIEELAGFQLDGDPEFVARMSAAIEQREVTTSLVDLSSTGLLTVVFEYIGFVLGFLFPQERDEEGSE